MQRLEKHKLGRHGKRAVRAQLFHPRRAGFPILSGIEGVAERPAPTVTTQLAGGTNAVGGYYVCDHVTGQGK